MRDDNNDPLVRVRHIRLAGLCSRGTRQWFTSRNLDYGTFINDGLRASQVEALNDALGNRVAQVARDEVLKGRP